jgi:hypothetical protein
MMIKISYKWASTAESILNLQMDNSSKVQWLGRKKKSLPRLNQLWAQKFSKLQRLCKAVLKQ